MLCPSCGRDNPTDAQFCNGCGANPNSPVAETAAPPEETALFSSGSFVGRQQEMAELRTALEDSLSGRGRLVMLAGEPGIGKSRAAQEIGAYAELRGSRVLWGRCYEEQGTPAYWPWVQAIRAYVREQDAESIRAAMGPGASDIAAIIPELRDKLPDLEHPPDLEPEQARFRLFDSITTFFRNSARTQPLVIILDDLHWADPASLLLLEFVAREMADCQLLVVGAYRDVELSRSHPLSETLGGLARERLFQRIPLRGLGPKDLELLIEATADIALPASFAAAVHSHTDGNPFFAIEVIRALREEGELTPEGLGEGRTWAIRIPEGVREAIGRRLNRLSGECNQVLTMASVIGRGFELGLLSRLIAESSEEDLLEALEEGLGASIIVEVPGSATGFQFSHALIQETLSGELSAARRVRLHAQIGQALEELYGDDTQGHAAELAHHFEQAQTLLGTDKLIRYTLMAGEQALASSAYENAVTYFERGLVARNIALSGTEAATDEEAADLLFGLARAQSATLEGHQLVEAFATLSRAFEYYTESGNVAQAVAVAEFPIAPPAYRIPGAAEIVARALTLVPDDSHEAGRLLSRYGGILGDAECDYEGGQQALERAIAIARREEDVRLEVQALTYAALVSGQHLHLQESVDNGLRAIELATGDEYPFSDLASRYWIVRSLLRMGDLEAARPHALVMRDLAERRSTPRSLADNGFMMITTLSCLEGDWKAGRESSDRGLEVSPLFPHLLGIRVLLEYETGESDQGEVFLERLALRRTGPVRLNAYVRMSIAIPMIARITGVSDRLEIAEAAAEAVLSNQSVTPIVAMNARVGLALVAVQNGDRSAAEGHYALLLGQRSTMIATAISVDRLLGLLSQTMGNLDQATGHFEEALSFCRKAGYRPELAWTCPDYADMLLERSGEGNRAKAIALLDQSLAISSELGMRPLMERVIALQERAKAQPPKAPTFPDGLTQREVEVLRLVAAGKTDRGIAEELFLSTRTVTTHVSNILNKTNAANRAEAAVYASRNGLA